ncbi:hypothetical protein ACH6CV_05000 [Bacillota bacterium Meth-B3]
MKIKLSETIPARERDAELRDVWDEDAMRRVRDRVLERVGLAPRLAGRRRAGRRAAIVLAALLTVMLAFATALATTDLGVMVADMFRDYGGPKEVLDALGVYGGAVGCKDTQDGLTVRVEAAFAGEAESMVALSFEDAQGRLGEGMECNLALTGSEGGSYYLPKKSPDGRTNALVTFPNDQSLAGQNVELTIDGIIPEIQRFYSQPTALTLGEAVQKPMPFPVPGVPEARFTAIRMAEGGLVISVEWPSDGLMRFGGLALRAPGSRLMDKIGSSRNRMLGEQSAVQSHHGFAGLELEKVLDYELIVDYAREAPALDGVWKLRFQMPRSMEERTEVPIGGRITMDDLAYTIDGAVIYPAYVTVDFHALDDRVFREPVASNANSIFYGRPRFPGFTLVDEGGQTIAELDSIEKVNQDDGATRYRATMYCLTQKQDTLTLNVRDESGKVLRSYKLK